MRRNRFENLVQGALFCAALLVTAPTLLAGGTSVTLVTPRCVTIGTDMIVDLRIGPGAPSIVGLQSALSYNGAVLQFVSEEPGDAPFDLPIYFTHNSALSNMSLAVGIAPPNAPSAGNVVAKRLRFHVIGAAGDCTPDQLVQFRADRQVRNLLTDSNGTAILPVLASLNEVNLGPGPSISAAADVVGTPPVGSMQLITNLGVVTASGCGPILNLTFVRSDGELVVSAPFERVNSPISIVWTVTDECGRSASDTQLVTVNVVYGDLSQNGIVDASDISIALNSWGPANAAGTGDVDGDGTINAKDIALLLNNWGSTTP